MHREFRRAWACATLALAAVGAAGQTLLPADPDWRELDAPPPPALKTERLIAIDMPLSLLRFGVDPASVSLSSDGIVRYVVVAASSSGAINASYEGVRCATGQFKVYARHNPDSGWVRAQGEWRSLQDPALASRHSLEIARNGACMGRGTAPTAAQIVRDLRGGVDTRYRPELR